jgi:DNA-binding LacI/PurR family transcriptional regulator
MGTTRRVTLNDVAAACGLSRATVSFVLNDDPRQTFSELTRRRVRDAARELGYVPHGIARALREGNSRAVVLTIETGLEGHYTRTFVRGLDAELAAHDHVLLVRHGKYPLESADQVLDAVSPRAVLDFGSAYRSGHDLEDQGGGWRDGLAAHAAIQMGHLAERGHTRIAFALPDIPSPVVDARLKFSTEAGTRLGLQPLVRLSLSPRRAVADEVMRAFRVAYPEVTAIAGFDDDVALRALSSLIRLGARVPQDMAVIGFDAGEHGDLFQPSLTSVHIDAEAHGRAAARRVLGLDETDLVFTPGRVIQREST